MSLVSPGSGNGAKDAPPAWSNFLYFHVIFGENLAKYNRFLPQTQGLASTVWEILDPPLSSVRYWHISSTVPDLCFRHILSLEFMLLDDDLLQ